MLLGPDQLGILAAKAGGRTLLAARPEGRPPRVPLVESSGMPPCPNREAERPVMPSKPAAWDELACPPRRPERSAGAVGNPGRSIQGRFVSRVRLLSDTVLVQIVALSAGLEEFIPFIGPWGPGPALVLDLLSILAPGSVPDSLSILTVSGSRSLLCVVMPREVLREIYRKKEGRRLRKCRRDMRCFGRTPRRKKLVGGLSFIYTHSQTASSLCCHFLAK